MSTDRRARLASLLGDDPAPSTPSPSLSHAPAIAADVARALDEHASLTQIASLARALARERGAHPMIERARALLLRDRRVHEAATRDALARALASRETPEALMALAEALDAVGLEPEARAFGALAARGVTRFHTPRAPFALEYESGDGHSPLDRLAQQLGPLEPLRDTSTRVRVTRVRIATLPTPMPLPPAPKLAALFDEAAKRSGARVWIAGCALRASLARATWIALLTPLAGG